MTNKLPRPPQRLMDKLNFFDRKRIKSNKITIHHFPSAKMYTHKNLTWLMNVAYIGYRDKIIVEVVENALLDMPQEKMIELINRKDTEGYTALMHCVTGHTPIFNEIFSSNPDYDIIPLSMVDMLLRLGADIDKQANDGGTALLLAVTHDTITYEIVKKMIEYSPEINLDKSIFEAIKKLRVSDEFIFPKEYHNQTRKIIMLKQYGVKLTDYHKKIISELDFMRNNEKVRNNIEQIMGITFGIKKVKKD